MQHSNFCAQTAFSVLRQIAFSDKLCDVPESNKQTYNDSEVKTKNEVIADVEELSNRLVEQLS
jgi:hypothetical protein